MAVAGWALRLAALERKARRRLDTPTAPWPDLPAAPAETVPPAARPGPQAEDAPPPQPAPAAGSEPWVPPLEGGACPAGHPVKAKLRSRVFHLPGMAAYDRTAADRCYIGAEAAEADGFRRASR